MPRHRIWYSFRSGQYNKNEPEVFANANLVSGLSEVVRNFSVIKTELHHYLESNLLEAYFNKTLSNEPDGWKTGMFKFWGLNDEPAQKEIPETLKVMSSIPAVLSFSLSILEPHKEVKPHYGDTNAIYRFHLGLEIPEGLPGCGIEVNGIQEEWEEGGLFGFCDAYQHTAWNKTDKRRVVLIFDVLRPEFIREKNSICANILSAMAVQKNPLLSGKNALIKAFYRQLYFSRFKRELTKKEPGIDFFRSIS